MKRSFRGLFRAVWLAASEVSTFRPSISLLRHHRLILDTVGEKAANLPVRSNRYVDYVNVPICRSLTYFI